MSDPKHTPKPWLVKPDSIDVFDKYGYTICEVYKGKEGIANRRLIAAAPDMLEALEAAIKCGMVPITSASEGGASAHSEQVRVADRIRAAITKAKGDSQ